MRIEERQIEVGGHTLLLRNAGETDAEMLLTFLRDTCGETRFLAKEPEEITLTMEEERAFINAQNASETNLMLLAFWDGKHVGNCSFMGLGDGRYRHRASVGIALYQKYTGFGIGSRMMEVLIAAAKEAGFEQLELEVVTDNKRAIALYKKMGFEIFGTLPDNMKYKDGTYADVYWMMKKLSEKTEYGDLKQ